jgi:hypothetical protein
MKLSDRARARLRMVYVVGLVAALAAPQVRAQVRQVRFGYRPFSTSPGRVSYSWDMFATRVERCDVRWDPPLVVDGRSVSHMSDRSAPVEFDTIYDDREDYRGFAYDACARFSTGPTMTTLRCALPSGQLVELHDPCP